MAFIPYFILVLLVTIAVDYYAGIKIEETVGSKRKWYLVASIVITCLVLIIFKYFGFLNANLQALANFFHWNYSIGLFEIILPIGLSFHTFQSLSYVIEVYRNKQSAERNFGIYALYVMFYPQLVAGPIERPQNLLHQFYERHYFDYIRVTTGLKRMAWGFFKKIVIADNLALYVNNVYANPQDHSGLTLLLATFFFAIQIYCDFSGYSDIAIGTAQVMGFKLMENFKNPYFSLSVAEFWTRWHISLSTWFKDYVYVPLGGNRVKFPRWSFNILVTFLLSGFWHGANWTYVIWGGLHGTYLISYRFIENIFKIKLPRLYQSTSKWIMVSKWLLTFSFILITWVFFRANTVNDAFYIIKIIGSGLSDFKSTLAPLPGGPVYLAYYFFLILILALAEGIDYRGNLIATVSRLGLVTRWTIYFLIVFAIMNLGVIQEIPFIYFQF